MDYKHGKWAKQIVQLQHDDGSWGYFHTLSNPSPKQPITTEQALRRLKVLGYTYADEPIRKAVSYMHNCLVGKNKLPDREEKLHNWNIFTELMLAAWITMFTGEDSAANNAAQKWAEIINAAFTYNEYSNDLYISSYRNVFGLNPRGGRLVDFVSFYQVSLLTNKLNKNIEKAYFKYLLEHETGIYYIYSKRLLDVPGKFQSKETSSYLRAIELLAKYQNPELKKELGFVLSWINKNKIGDNLWDTGKEIKDGIDLPLSDSWRNEKNRIEDCTYRIKRILNFLDTNNNRSNHRV